MVPGAAPLVHEYRDEEGCQGKVDALGGEGQDPAQDGAQGGTGHPITLIEQAHQKIIPLGVRPGAVEGVGLVRQGEDQVWLAPAGVAVFVDHGNAVKEVPGVDHQGRHGGGE